ncbi:MAG: hypothetical protein ACJ70X_03300 [Nitrososphaera sp.]
MNAEMNSNNRKNLSKTLAIASMGFLIIAAAFTFTIANSGLQLVSAQQNQTQGAQQNQTQGGNTPQMIVAVPFDTFTANGKIAGTIQEQGGGGSSNQSAAGGSSNQSAAGGSSNQSAAGGSSNQSAAGGGSSSGAQGSQYLLAGDWNINAQSGNVTGFAANFIMVHPDGTGYHTHNITNYRIGNSTVQLVQGQPLKISGTGDFDVNGTTKWTGVNTTLTFSPNADIMTIMPAAEDTDNHFQGQPIYGVVSQITGENGTIIAQTMPPGQQQQQQGGGGGNPLSGLFGGGNQQGGQQQGGNQSGGGNPLSGLGEQIGNLFGGGGNR